MRPHKNDADNACVFRLLQTFFVIIGLTFSFFNSSNMETSHWFLAGILLDIVLIFVFEELSSSYRFKVEKFLREEMIDNALGTNRSIEKTSGYYDTEDVPVSYKKLLLNLAESVIYTKAKAEALKKYVSVSTLICFMGMVVLGIFGFTLYPSVITLVFTVFFGFLILKPLKDSDELIRELENIKRDIQIFFYELHQNERDLSEQDYPRIYLLFTDYQVAKAKSSLTLCEFLYNITREKAEREYIGFKEHCIGKEIH